MISLRLKIYTRELMKLCGAADAEVLYERVVIIAGWGCEGEIL